MNRLSLIFLTGLVSALPTRGEVKTYSYPEVTVPDTQALDSGTLHTVFNKRSARYQVSVTQNSVTKSAYVMHSPNPFVTGNLSRAPDNHWTNFSFDGQVTVTITRLGSNISSCDLFPLRKGHTATISGNQATFSLHQDDLPLQLWARINGENNDALLIFADPLETDVPNRNDSANVDLIQTTDNIATVRAKLSSTKPHAVFEEGVHQWGPAQDESYPGYLLPYISNKSIHIPGGAYVIGTFNGNNVANTRIHGRGVLSACGKHRLPGPEAIPYSFVTSTSNGPDQIEGVICTDPPHFHLTYRGEVEILNVKMLGWWHQTDGIVTGNDSKIHNCFIKTNDDYIKLYAQRVHCRNTTMFHQSNGAPFQFCWSTQNGDNNLAENTYIIQSDYSTGTNTRQNTAVINSRNGSGAITENNTWDGIYIENGTQKLIGLNAGSNPATIFRNFIVRNVAIDSGDKSKPQNGGSYLENGSAGNFQNIHFENLAVDGDPILASNTGSDVPDDGSLWYVTGGSFVTYSQTGAPGFSVNAGQDLVVTASPWRGMATVPLSASFQNATGTPVTAWSLVSGPGPATFRDATHPATAVTFNGPGTWVLRSSATDGGQTAEDYLTVTVQPASAGTGNETTYFPSDDAYLQNGTRFNNTLLRVQPGNRISYLKFDLAGLSGPVTAATLELTESTDTGNGTLRIHSGNSNLWNQTDLTPANSPSKIAELATFTGPIGDDQTISFDFTAAIPGNGIYSFILEMDNGGNDAAFGSSESAVPPVLRVVTATPAPPSGTFAAWQQAWFTSQELENPELGTSLWGNNATPSGDLPNFARHALGYSPFEPASFHTTIEPGDPDELVLTCDRASDATGANYQLEYSEDLTDWDPAAPENYTFSTDPIDPHFERARWTITRAPHRAFYRLRLTPE